MRRPEHNNDLAEILLDRMVMSGYEIASVSIQRDRVRDVWLVGANGWAGPVKTSASYLVSGDERRTALVNPLITRMRQAVDEVCASRSIGDTERGGEK